MGMGALPGFCKKPIVSPARTALEPRRRFSCVDAVLVDETQDFHPTRFSCILLAMKDPYDGDLLIVCDGN